MGELCDHVTGLCHCPHGVNCGQTTEFSQSAEITTEFKNLETTKQYNVKTTSECESTYFGTFDRETEEVMKLESDDIMTHNDTFIVRDGLHKVKSDVSKKVKKEPFLFVSFSFKRNIILG